MSNSPGDYVDHVLLYGCSDVPLNLEESCFVELLETRPPDVSNRNTNIQEFLWPIEPPSFLPHPVSTIHSFILTDEGASRTFVHCLNLHLRQETKKIFSPFSIVLFTQFKFHCTFLKILQHFQSYFEENNTISDLEPILSLLFSALHVPLDLSISNFTVELLSEEFYFNNLIINKSMTSQFTPVDMDFEPLCRFLDPTNIIIIENCLLCSETSVLFISDEPQHLFHIQECMLTLIYPFNYPFTYIPLLPRNQNDLIHLPNLYVMGTCSTSICWEEIPDHILVVNLCENRIICAEKLKIKLPLELAWRLDRGLKQYQHLFPGISSPNPELEELPTSSLSLKNKRSSFFSRLPQPVICYEDLNLLASGSEDEFTENETNPEDLDFTKLRSIFLSVFVSLLQGYRSFLNVPEGKDLNDLSKFPFFKKQLFIDKHPRSRSDNTFLTSWVNSQIFSAFTYDRIMLPQEDYFERLLRKKYVNRKESKQRLESTGICGIMWKMGRNRKNWNKRFFMLQQNILSYFSAVEELVEVVQQLSQARSDLQKAQGTLNVEALKCLVLTLERDLEEIANSRRKGEMELPIGDTKLEIPTTEEAVQGVSTFQSVPTEYSFYVITPERTLLVATNDPYDRRSWIQHIRARTTLLIPNPTFKAASPDVRKHIKRF